HKAVVHHRSLQENIRASRRQDIDVLDDQCHIHCVCPPSEILCASSTSCARCRSPRHSLSHRSFAFLRRRAHQTSRPTRALDQRPPRNQRSRRSTSTTIAAGTALGTRRSLATANG